ncbi:MAG TPA: IclR family transcriptional regulator [Firmicutes bacterium]|nr:IclR family transcriptional regulator [Bacillota bacterium]
MGNRHPLNNAHRPPASPPTIQVLSKAMAILSAFSIDEPSLTLAQVASRTELPKTTAHRLLVNLQRLGLVVPHPLQENVYILGPRLMELGAAALAGFDLRLTLAPHLDKLHQSVLHTVLVATLIEDHLLYIDRRESQYTLAVTSRVGSRRPPHFGAIGKAIMAFLPDEEVDRLLQAHPLQPLTAHTVVDPAQYRAALKEVKNRGYAVADEEVVEGVKGVAAPVFDQSGNVAAAVGVAVPKSLITDEQFQRIIYALLQTAQAASCDLGFYRWPYTTALKEGMQP